jgi:pimeloyl-ACP methyl ester carboxylesterase
VATHAGFESEDFFATWPQVPASAVLLYGGASPVVTAAGAAEAAATNPAARLVEVPGAGHMVFWDEPEVALRLLRDEVLTAFATAAADDGRYESLSERGELSHARATRRDARP